MTMSGRRKDYVLVSRGTVETEIWKKPPLYFKVWMYLTLRASQWKEWGLKQGQLYTSVSEIQDSCSWKVGYRTRRPSKREVHRVLEWLREIECEQRGNPSQWSEQGLFFHIK